MTPATATDVIRSASAANEKALDVWRKCLKAQAPKLILETAELNAINAGKALQLAIACWMKTL